MENNYSNPITLLKFKWPGAQWSSSAQLQPSVNRVLERVPKIMRGGKTSGTSRPEEELIYRRSVLSGGKGDQTFGLRKEVKVRARMPLNKLGLILKLFF